MRRPAIVTGAAGFAGSHVLDLLVATLPPDQPIVAWHRPGGRAPRVSAARSSSRLSWTAVDVLDAPAVQVALASSRPATIYHCAGSPHVASSWTDTLTPLELNVLGTRHLLHAVERYVPDARIVVPGSALVYRQTDGRLDEESPLRPRTPYGVSKLAQEMLARRAAENRGLSVLVARPFNHIGPRQDPTFVASAFARQIAEAEAGLGAGVIRVGNLDARRDLTDVRDTVRAYCVIAERGAPGRPYNICTGQARRIGDLLEHLLLLGRVPVRVEVDPERLRPSDHPVLVGDPCRIERELGWHPEIPFEQTLADLLDDWRDRVRNGPRA